MARHWYARRWVVAVLLALGALLMLLAPSVGPGLIVFGCGVALELVGIATERRGPPDAK